MGKPAREDLVLSRRDHLVVPKGEQVTRERLTRLKELVQGALSRLHTEIGDEREETVSRLDAINADIRLAVSEEKVQEREAYELMLSTRNLPKPADGEPIIGPTKDMVLGCYYLTMAQEGMRGEGMGFADIEDLLPHFRHGEGSVPSPASRCRACSRLPVACTLLSPQALALAAPCFAQCDPLLLTLGHEMALPLCVAQDAVTCYLFPEAPEQAFGGLSLSTGDSGHALVPSLFNRCVYDMRGRVAVVRCAHRTSDAGVVPQDRYDLAQSRR